VTTKRNTKAGAPIMELSDAGKLDDAIAELKRGAFVTLPGTHATVTDALEWCDENGLENPILERGPDNLIRGRAQRK
jgi:hypothetical protein